MYKRLSDFPEIIRFCMNISLVLERIIQHHRRVVLLCDPLFSRFSRTLTCDRRTDRHRHAQGHSMYRASIASRGKNCRQFQQVTRQPLWNKSREMTSFMGNRLSLSSYSHVTFFGVKTISVNQGRSQDFEFRGLKPMASAEREHITGVWGRAPSGVQGQSPWWGSGGRSPLKLKGF